MDASAGIAGDMLLGALIDAGADLAAVQEAVDAVLPGAVRLTRAGVQRAGLAATKVDVQVLLPDQPHRGASTIRGLIDRAGLAPRTRQRAQDVFARLAQAEARVHGIDVEQVHFHEVGALDSIADVVGVCAALEELGVDQVSGSAVAVGSGTVRSAHGQLPVPAPAVVELCRGWSVLAGGSGELATPTGVALLTTLAERAGDVPAMQVQGSGTGAGTRDMPGRANVVRVLLGAPSVARVGADGGGPPEEEVVLVETNIDDLDPRVWPFVLEELIAAGALDAWLTPVLMKKGRPGHTLHVLAEAARRQGLTEVVLRHTSTLGVRWAPVRREVLQREWQEVAVLTGRVRIKLGLREGEVLQAMPELADVAALAEREGRAVADVLTLAHAAAVRAGLVAGADR